MSSDNINRAVSLTSYFFSLPPSPFIFAAIIFLGVLFGFLIDFGRYSGEQYIIQSLIDGFMLLIAPALLATLVIKLLIRKMPIRRILATAFGGELVYAIAYSVSLLISGVDLFIAELVLLIGAAIVFVFWYAIARLVFLLKYRSVLFAIIQLLFYLIFFFSNKALDFTGEPIFDLAAKLYVSSFILLGALIIFFQIINAPMKKSFGFSSTDAATYFINQWLYQNKELEDALETVGQRVKTLVSVMGFRRDDGDFYFVTPYVHYGPFGNLGGSEFSHLIAKKMENKFGCKSFVFHGTVTHDLNPVASSEIRKVMKSIDNIVTNAEFKKGRATFARGKYEECIAEALTINKSAFVSVSRAPLVTEDINFGLGLSMMYKAENFVDEAMIVDQHNAETGEVTSFEPGEPVGYNYIQAVSDSLQKKSDAKNLKVGFSYGKSDSEVLGKAQIKCAVFNTEPMYVMILLDCNGITPEFQNRLIAEVKKSGKKRGEDWEVGVFTTDTHQTNMVKGVLNPLKEEENILEDVTNSVEVARDDVKEATYFFGRDWFEINVLGAKQSIELVSTVNSIVAVAKITAPLVLIGALLILFAILTKVW
jgi:putative membrane protein